MHGKRSKLLIGSSLCCLFAMAGLCFYAFTHAHWWSQSHGFAVSLNGQPISAQVFMGDDDLMYVNLKGNGYLLNTRRRVVYTAKKSDFVSMPGLVYCKRIPSTDPLPLPGAYVPAEPAAALHVTEQGLMFKLDARTEVQLRLE